MIEFGYFSAPGQTIPARDPGLDVGCPVCHAPLTAPLVTISFLVPGDDRSYFYRIHKACQSEKAEQAIESLIVDSVYLSREVN